jgi:hypothetical protein
MGLFGVNIKIFKYNSNSVILFCGFQKEVSHILGSSLGNGLDHIKYNMCCLTI